MSSPIDDREPILKNDELSEENNVITPQTNHSNKTLKWLDGICGVEIPILIFFASLGILLPAQQHFMYRRMCLFTFNSSAICDKIDSDPLLREQEAELQRTYSYYSTLHMVFLYLFSTFATILMGTWCDRFSFILPLLVPHLGTALGTLLFIIYYFLPITATHPALLTLPSIIYGVTGASPTEIMTAFAYISRVTTTGNRTVRVAIVEATIGFGTTLGYLISALVLGRSNTLLAFITQFCCSIYAVLFICLLLPELHAATFKEAANRDANGSLFRLFFVPGKKVLDGFRIVVRRFNSSLKIGIDRFVLLFLVLLTICFTVTSGISAIIFQYVTKHPISLSRSNYAIFHALVSGFASLNLLVTLRVLRLQWPPFLPLSDISLAAIGVLSRLISYVFMGFADFYPQLAPWFYAVISMGSGFFAASMRALLSKLVKATEKGSLFALVGVLESLSGLFASAIYNAIYTACIPVNGSTSLPFIRGLVFFFSAGVFLSPLLIFLWLLYTGEVRKLPFYLQPQVEQVPVTNSIATKPVLTTGKNETNNEVSDQRKYSVASSSASFEPNEQDSRFISLHRV